LTPEEEQVVAAGKERIAANLKDPNSAQFRRLFIAGKGLPMKFLCGEMNAKNSYGGYVGFKKFFTAAGAASFTAIDPEDPMRLFNYDIFCSESSKVKDVPN
jgi:hypothetical protein